MKHKHKKNVFKMLTGAGVIITGLSCAAGLTSCGDNTKKDNLPDSSEVVIEGEKNKEITPLSTNYRTITRERFEVLLEELQEQKDISVKIGSKNVEEYHNTWEIGGKYPVDRIDNKTGLILERTVVTIKGYSEPTVDSQTKRSEMTLGCHELTAFIMDTATILNENEVIYLDGVKLNLEKLDDVNKAARRCVLQIVNDTTNEVDSNIKINLINLVRLKLTDFTERENKDFLGENNIEDYKQFLTETKQGLAENEELFINGVAEDQFFGEIKVWKSFKLQIADKSEDPNKEIKKQITCRILGEQPYFPNKRTDVKTKNMIIDDPEKFTSTLKMSPLFQLEPGFETYICGIPKDLWEEKFVVGDTYNFDKVDLKTNTVVERMWVMFQAKDPVDYSELEAIKPVYNDKTEKDRVVFPSLNEFKFALSAILSVEAKYIPFVNGMPFEIFQNKGYIFKEGETYTISLINTLEENWVELEYECVVEVSNHRVQEQYLVLDNINDLKGFVAGSVQVLQNEFNSEGYLKLDGKLLQDFHEEDFEENKIYPLEHFNADDELVRVIRITACKTEKEVLSVEETIALLSDLENNLLEKEVLYVNGERYSPEVMKNIVSGKKYEIDVKKVCSHRNTERHHNRHIIVSVKK